MNNMFTDKVTRFTLLLSLTGHLLFLGMPFELKPNSEIDENNKELKIVYIEMQKPTLLPKIDVMGNEKKLKEVIERSESTEPEPAQEAMLRYQDMIKQKIEEIRRYPSRAKRQGIEGVVYINFIVLSNGLSRDIKIIRSSEFKILDEEAVKTIKRANPFPPIPREINQDFVSIEVAIVFTLE